MDGPISVGVRIFIYDVFSRPRDRYADPEREFDYYVGKGIGMLDEGTGEEIDRDLWQEYENECKRVFEAIDLINTDPFSATSRKVLQRREIYKTFFGNERKKPHEDLDAYLRNRKRKIEAFEASWAARIAENRQPAKQSPT